MGYEITWINIAKSFGEGIWSIWKENEPILIDFLQLSIYTYWELAINNLLIGKYCSQ